MGALSDAAVGELVSKHFVATYEKVGNFTARRFLNHRHWIRRSNDKEIDADSDGKNLVVKNGGNVVMYFCTPAGEVLNFVVGPVRPEVMLIEAGWARKLFLAIKDNEATKDGDCKTILRNLENRSRDRERRLNGLVMQPLSEIEQYVFEHEADQRGRFGRRNDRNDSLLAQLKLNFAEGESTLLVASDAARQKLEKIWRRQPCQIITVSQPELQQLLDDLDLSPPTDDTVAIIGPGGNQFPTFAAWTRHLETTASNALHNLSATVRRVTAASQPGE